MTTIKFDNLQRECFSRCPMEFYWAHRLHLQPESKSAALVFGIALHAGLEKFYKIVQSLGWDAARASLADCCEAIAASYAAESSEPGRTVPAGDWRTADLAIAAFLQYVQDYTTDAFTVHAVERYFELALPATALTSVPDSDGIEVIYCGNMDLALEYPNARRWLAVDHKTTSQWMSKALSRLQRHPQLVGYSWALDKLFPHAENAGPCANVLQVSCRKLTGGSWSTVTTNFDRTPHIVLSANDYRQWEEFIAWTAVQLHHYNTAGFFPQNLQACNREWGSCPYVQLCQTLGPDADPATISRYGFVVSEWNPANRRA